MANRHKNSSSAAMADIAFLLLLFFMVLAIATNRIPSALEKPTSIEAHADSQTPLKNLYITMDGFLSTDEGPIDLQGYLLQLNQACLQQPLTRPGILADRRTPYHLIAPVIEMLQSSGIRDVVFLVSTATEEL